MLPTPEELAANDDLIAELKAQNNFESPAETERRYACEGGFSWREAKESSRRKQTLQHIQKVTVEFIKVVSRRKGLSPAAVEASGGKIFTFGSYRLGVYGPGKCFHAWLFSFIWRISLTNGVR